MSPDGRHLAFLAPWQRRMNLFVRELASGTERRLTAAVTRDIVHYRWASSKRLAFVQDVDGDENWHLWSVAVDGSELQNLTPTTGVQARFISTLAHHDDQILIALNDRDPRLHDAWWLDVGTGGRRLVALNPGTVTEWLADYQGRVRVATTLEGTDTTILTRDDESSPWRAVLRHGLLDSVEPLYFTADERAIYAASNIGRSASAIVEISLEDGRELRVVAERPGLDLRQLSVSERRRVPTHVLVDAACPSFLCLDDAHAARQRTVDARLPGHLNRFSSCTDDEQIWTVHSSSDRLPGSHWLFDAAHNKLTHLWDSAPWIVPEAMMPVEPVSYVARDGRRIPAYLTRPRHASGPVPLVVNPHGGPWHRDSWSFRPDVQMLANRGYAVLQPNFRGSTGFGREHWQAGFGQWGLAMQDDVEDGVQWAVDEGIADPARIAIKGASYGGYVALTGVTRTPTLFRCAVNMCGVSNLLTLADTIPPYWELYRRVSEITLGHPERDRERLTATSPVLHADRIQVPLLIAQGAKDPRVPRSESDRVVEALRQRGVFVEYIVKEDEGHGFLKEENRLEFYRAVERFLATHLA